MPVPNGPDTADGREGGQEMTVFIKQVYNTVFNGSAGESLTFASVVPQLRLGPHRRSCVPQT